LKVESLKVLAKAAELPFDVRQADTKHFTVNFDNRPLSLRNQKIQDIFKIQESYCSIIQKF
jgi:aspartyl/asparaginyl-tRNA synthetase